MRERKAARLLVISPSRDVLLFKFLHKDGVLAGRNYWATPGGGLEDGETFHAAAIRELREETGIQINTVVGPVADRRFSMLLPSGETVFAVEQYFVVHAESQILSSSEWTLHVWHSHDETYEDITDLSQDEEPAGGSTVARPYEAGEHRSISRD